MLVFDKDRRRCVTPPTEDCEVPTTSAPLPARRTSTTAASTGTQAVGVEDRAQTHEEEEELLEGGLPKVHRVREAPCRWTLPRTGPLSPSISPPALSPSTECSTAPIPSLVMQ